MSKHHICPFSQLIQSSRCGCRFAAKNCIAEKEFGVCVDENASKNCTSLYQNLRQNSDFALNSHHQTDLSVGQQAKIKMGGLLALQELLTAKKNIEVVDIFTLVKQIKNHFQSFENLPFSKLMPQISAFKFRQK